MIHQESEGDTRRTQVDGIMNPKPIITPQNCTNSHGNGAFLEGTVYDSSLGVYVCPCGRQYHSDLPKPEEIVIKSSFTA